MKKLKPRSLTKNEKILLVVLGSIIVFWLAIRFVINPQMTKLSNLTEQRQEYDEKIAQMNLILRNEKNIDEEWTKLHKEKDLILSKYFSSLDQPQIIYLLNELLNNEEVDVLNMSFNTPNEEQIDDLTVKTMDITIPYNASYNGLIDTIEGVVSSPKKMLISNLIMDKDANSKLAGNMGFKIYSLEGIADIDEELAYIESGITGEKNNPFVAFEGFEADKKDSEEGAGGGLDSPYGPGGDMDDYDKQLLEDFDSGGIYFMSSHDNINGRISKSKNSKDKKNSLRLEYNILAIEDENRAYIDLTDHNIVIKYPPTSLGLWVHSYSYSPAILGLRLKGQAGEKIDVELSNGINWLGWDYIEASSPQDLSLYPLQLDRIYLELNYNRDDYGVLLFDKLEANYPKDINKTKERFTFYIVEKGDTLNKISLKNYGTIAKKNLIMKYNEIKSDNDLEDGKILVIPR